MLHHPWSYRFTIDENPIPLKRMCVLKHSSSRLNTIPKADAYQIIQSNLFCVHIIVQGVTRYKGLCQNNKHGFDQYTKGGHFCATHIALRSEYLFPSASPPSLIFKWSSPYLPLQLLLISTITLFLISTITLFSFSCLQYTFISLQK